jgi:hypothetical protein
VEQDQTNEMAWYWLFQVFDRVDDQRVCLENLILINPKNMWAKQELLALLDAAAAAPVRAAQPAPPSRPAAPLQKPQDTTAPDNRPVTLKLVTAFWAGISLMFLGGGIFSALEWITIQTQPGPGQLFPLLDLTLSVIFVITGIMGLTVAVALYFQSMAGVVGSLFLALGLLLAGPTFSLITNPPNYVAMTCTGGISGMIVLLTLATQIEKKGAP